MPNYTLFGGTVQPNNTPIGGTVQPNNTPFGGAVQPNNPSFGGTVQSNNTLFGGTVQTKENYLVQHLIQTNIFFFNHFWQFLHGYYMFFYYRLLSVFQKLVRSIVIVKI